MLMPGAELIFMCPRGHGTWHCHTSPLQPDSFSSANITGCEMGICPSFWRWFIKRSCVVVVRRSVKEQRGPMRFFIILSPIPRPSCAVLRTRLGDLATTHPSPPWLETWCCLVPGLVPRLVLAGVAPPSTSCRHFPTLDIEYSSIIPAWARTNQ